MPISARQFEQWMRAVDERLLDKLGITTEDLGDWDYREAFDGGASPSEVVREVLTDNGYRGKI